MVKDKLKRTEWISENVKVGFQNTDTFAFGKAESNLARICSTFLGKTFSVQEEMGTGHRCVCVLGGAGGNTIMTEG